MPQADIKAGGSTVFRVAFRPGRNQYYYSHRLECFSYIKTQRNFRLVSEGNITPPWCLNVLASGNTFVTGDHSGMPKVKKQIALNPYGYWYATEYKKYLE